MWGCALPLSVCLTSFGFLSAEVRKDARSPADVVVDTDDVDVCGVKFGLLGVDVGGGSDVVDCSGAVPVDFAGAVAVVCVGVDIDAVGVAGVVSTALSTVFSFASLAFFCPVSSTGAEVVC